MMAANLFGRIKKKKIWVKEVFFFFINPHLSNTNLQAAAVTDWFAARALPRQTDELVQIIVAGTGKVRQGL